MLSLTPTVRIWLSTRPADLRKSLDILAALVRDGLRGDPLSGDILLSWNPCQGVFLRLVERLHGARLC